MGKESFKYLYPMIQAALEGPDRFMSAAVGALNVKSEKAFKEEAEKLIQFMDSYKEPELPFKDITTEQIEKAIKDHENHYGFVVWSNKMAGSDEDCAERVKNDPDNYLGWSEDDVRTVSYEANAEERDIMKAELDSIDVNHILIYGTFGRWDGAKPACVIKDSIVDAFELFTGDDCTMYINDGQLRVENAHHDGTDRFSIYTFREDVDVEEKCWETQQEVLKDTMSLVPILVKHFGWTLPEGIRAERSDAVGTKRNGGKTK